MKTKEYDLHICVRLHDSTNARNEVKMKEFIEDYFQGHTYTSMFTTFNTRVLSIEERTPIKK